MNEDTKFYVVGGVALIIVLFVSFSLLSKPVVPFGSVAQSNEYQSTTTRPNVFPADYVLQTYPGSLGSVVITGAAAGAISLYDATTSNVNLRTGQAPTTTILLANFQNSTVAGTYQIDSRFQNGLLLNITGTIPTSTITYR